MKRPTCWRCEEPITWYYRREGVRTLRRRLNPLQLGSLPETFLCADCTDEIAELSAP